MTRARPLAKRDARISEKVMIYTGISQAIPLERTNLKYAVAILPVSDRMHHICIEPMNKFQFHFE
jgi:hypothetical protein